MEQPRILIVDDEDNVRSALVRWFTIQGFHVEQASNGVEALACFKPGAFDVITLDMEMPEMGGLDALAAIRAQDEKVPVLIVTGFPRDAEIALQRGALKVLHKPLRLNELEAEVRGAIDGSKGA